MSQAVVHGDTVYVAGQVASASKASVEDQTRDVLGKIDALLAEAGTDKSKLLAVNVFLVNIADFAAMNSVYDTGSTSRTRRPAPASRPASPIPTCGSR